MRKFGGAVVLPWQKYLVNFVYATHKKLSYIVDLLHESGDRRVRIDSWAVCGDNTSSNTRSIIPKERNAYFS